MDGCFARDTRQSACSRSARQFQQHGFGLVVRVVRSRNHRGVHASRGAYKEPVPRVARRHFQGHPFSRGGARNVRTARDDVEATLPRETGDKGRVFLARAPANAMIEVGNGEGDAQ